MRDVLRLITAAAYAAFSAAVRVTVSVVSTGTGSRRVLIPGQPSNDRRSTSLSLSSEASLTTLMLMVTFWKAERRRIRHHVAAHVEVGTRHRLEAVVGHPELGGVEGEHRRVAADRAGQQELERRRRAILPAHMHRFADDEFVAALLAVDELVELADRGHFHFHEAPRPLGCRLVGMRTVAALARVGDILQLREAIADLDHSISPERACGSPFAIPAHQLGE
jgi:hypothetical protein